MKIFSPAFAENAKIPKQYTCDGQDMSPPLTIEDVPATAKSLALVMDDPDAPGGTWVHWILWNVGPITSQIKQETVPVGAIQGINSFRKSGYGGPCPPSGSHRYYFTLYALDIVLDLPPTATKGQLEKAMRGHVVGECKTMGRYR